MNPITVENAVVLDTETTGLGSDAEICEISIIDMQGNALLDTLIKPARPIPPDAMAIHGITNEMVANAPSWSEVCQDVVALLNSRYVIIYNASYDVRLMLQSSICSGLDRKEALSIFRPIKNSAFCAMLAYAEFYGDWNEYHGNYKWQSLTNAAQQQGIDISDLSAHRAMADCEITRRLILAVNKQLGGAL